MKIGIVGCGFVGSSGAFAIALEGKANAKGRYYQCIRQVLAAAVNGIAPGMAVEVGRRNIYSVDRPSFEELEEALRELQGSG